MSTKEQDPTTAALEAATQRRDAPAPSARDHIMQFFVGGPPIHLARLFSDLAESIHADIPRNPERTVALRKLLEAKEAVARACIADGGGR